VTSVAAAGDASEAFLDEARYRFVIAVGQRTSRRTHGLAAVKAAWDAVSEVESSDAWRGLCPRRRPRLHRRRHTTVLEALADDRGSRPIGRWLSLASTIA
jgi:hypothetical protein